MRTLVPAETLVYLETNDLAAALQPIVDAKPFREVAKSKPDFSALKGVQLAVAVTGFETSEEKLTDEHSVGRVQPHFVAVAETHAWQFQTVRFAEQKLGAFVAEMYDSEPTLESSEKGGGRYLVWTAKDGRKAFAVVSRSLIYFGNDESAIEKCLAVQRGEADSLAKAGKVKPADPVTLASGYVSTDGVAQIANIVGLKFATEAGEDSEVQSAIAGILPQLIRNSVTDVSWTSTKTEQGIEDKYQITMPAEVANVFNETMAPAPESDQSLQGYLPAEVETTTLYHFKDTNLAWQSVLAIAQKQTSPLAANIIRVISSIFSQPYGIEDMESFLSGCKTNIVTTQLPKESDDDERYLVIASVKDETKMKKGISSATTVGTAPIDQRRNANKLDFLLPKEGPACAFIEDKAVCGDGDSLLKAVDVRQSNAKPMERYGSLLSTQSSISTLGRENQSALLLISFLAREGHGDTEAVSTYLTETRFTKSGMERKTTSDFGLIGAIIAQLAQD